MSAQIDYACRALLELSLHWPNTSPLRITEIAKKQDVPIKFLVHILLKLKQSGYVESVRGQKGGYLLAKSPDKINLNEVIGDFGGSGYGAEASNRTKKKHMMDMIWKEVDDQIVQTMGKINFETIRDRCQVQDKTLTYEI